MQILDRHGQSVVAVFLRANFIHSDSRCSELSLLGELCLKCYVVLLTVNKIKLLSSQFEFIWSTFQNDTCLK